MTGKSNALLHNGTVQRYARPLPKQGGDVNGVISEFLTDTVIVGVLGGVKSDIPPHALYQLLGRVLPVALGQKQLSQQLFEQGRDKGVCQLVIGVKGAHQCQQLLAQSFACRTDQG